MFARSDNTSLPDLHLSLDFAGVGVGPANLSLAALAAGAGSLRFRCFERKHNFDWHAGLLLPAAGLQVSFLKDLVSLVDPTNRYSFVNFLATHRRLYSFIAAGFPQVLRSEYEQYYSWVARSIASLHFGDGVRGIDFNHGVGAFSVETESDTYFARNVVLGTGLAAYVPQCARTSLGATVFHASRFLSVAPDLRGKRVALVGGGQTAAELASHILNSTQADTRIDWYTRRDTLLPLDESAFTNEFFVPAYTDYFYGLPARRRAELLASHRLASDGISPPLLLQLYRQLYEWRHIRGEAARVTLMPGTELCRMERAWPGWTLALRRADDGVSFEADADVVILCTGYRYEVPDCVARLAARFRTHDDGFAIGEDFAVEWDGPAHNRVYLQSAARHARGVADPNLSLVPWRSAKILNSIAGRQLYALEDGDTMATWRAPTVAALPDAMHG